MDIAYAALTESCTFMLDAEGICRWVVASNPASPANKAGARRWEKSQQAAARCIGAQYVASLDVSTSGGLVDMPRVGVPMLFARVDRNGRVSLVRTGPVLRFEDRTAHGQAQQRQEEYDSGMRERPRDDSEYMDEVDTHRRQPRYEDERTHPFQVPNGVVNRARRTLPPPVSPREMASRLPPPHAPPRRARVTSLPAPPMNSRPARPPADEESYEREPSPPTIRRSNAPPPLWASRRR